MNTLTWQNICVFIAYLDMKLSLAVKIFCYILFEIKAKSQIYECILAKICQRVNIQDINYFLVYSQGKTCALLNSVQIFIEIQGWLLLTFSICLQNQLNTFF